MERNLPEGCHADFKHVTELYNKEATMSLKKVHRLTPAMLQPKSIEKTSVYNNYFFKHNLIFLPLTFRNSCY